MEVVAPRAQSWSLWSRRCVNPRWSASPPPPPLPWLCRWEWEPTRASPWSPEGCMGAAPSPHERCPRAFGGRFQVSTQQRHREFPRFAFSLLWPKDFSSRFFEILSRSGCVRRNTRPSPRDGG